MSFWNSSRSRAIGHSIQVKNNRSFDSSQEQYVIRENVDSKICFTLCSNIFYILLSVLDKNKIEHIRHQYTIRMPLQTLSVNIILHWLRYHVGSFIVNIFHTISFIISFQNNVFLLC